MLNAHKRHFDVAIIGSGISGSTLASILARQGSEVILFEAGSHPKFTIGESMILETSETMRAIAELYDVPELAYFSSANYFSSIGTSHGIKRHFGFLHHSESQPQQTERSLQAVIPKQPHGHELHLYRQDVDYFLVTCAIKYGATVLQNRPIADIEIGGKQVQITDAEGHAYTADYIVDAGGFRSPLAEKFDLRNDNMQTHSRAIFTHMINVPDYHEVAASQRTYGIPFSMDEGTLHHIFDGGWLWVIPFNNHSRSTNNLCSVGLMLDPRVYPQNDLVTPEEEFYEFITRFPDIAAQFTHAKAVRNWTRTGRIQYSSTRIVGDRFALLGHAAGFIDPLFSKGLYSTLTSVSVLAHYLLEAKSDGDYSAHRFRPLEEMTLKFLNTNDRLIANAYKTFGNYKLWTLMSVLWLLGAYTEYLKLLSLRARSGNRREYIKQLQMLHLVGGGFKEFRSLEKKVYEIIEQVDLTSSQDVDKADAEIRAVLASISWMPLPFQAILDGKNHLPRAKIRPDLLDPKNSFMRSGEYRAHFFGERAIGSLLQALVQEIIKYSAPAIYIRRHLGQV